MKRPFYCGSQYSDWVSENCERCSRGYDYEAGTWRCELQRALDEAYLDTGEVADEVAERIGYREGLYIWRCAEYEKKEE